MANEGRPQGKGGGELIPNEQLVDIGFQMYLRHWSPPEAAPSAPPFLLVHGLASNARTWDEVARRLAAAGHETVAIDQRGHGRSDKPAADYDFATITGDLHRLLDRLGWQQAVLAGQSWGGNVLLEFGARFPGRARQLIFVDGGFLDLRQRGSWEKVARELRPPDLNGTPRERLAAWIQKSNPGWSAAGVEATLHNFETLPDGTIRPWLTLERHLAILRSLYEQDPAALYPLVEEPVLICVADDGGEWSTRKRKQAQAAASALQRAEIAWFKGAAHDIHVDRPAELVARFLQFSDRQERSR
jgi:pimeloyl-ACP methyl ester carboxylesterase